MSSHTTRCKRLKRIREMKEMLEGTIFEAQMHIAAQNTAFSSLYYLIRLGRVVNYPSTNLSHGCRWAVSLVCNTRVNSFRDMR
jgi:hypothetical protein